MHEKYILHKHQILICKHFMIRNISREKFIVRLIKLSFPGHGATVHDDDYKGILRIIKGDIIFVYRRMKMRDDDMKEYT